jgi:hypothetical protein
MPRLAVSPFRPSGRVVNTLQNQESPKSEVRGPESKCEIQDLGESI